MSAFIKPLKQPERYTSAAHLSNLLDVVKSPEASDRGIAIASLETVIIAARQSPVYLSALRMNPDRFVDRLISIRGALVGGSSNNAAEWLHELISMREEVSR